MSNTASLYPKTAVRLATTVHTDQVGLPIIDVVQTVDGDRILDKNNRNAAKRGIFIARAGAWTRASDMAADSDLTLGVSVSVTAGTANAGLTFVMTNDAPVVLGTTPLSFSSSVISNPNGATFDFSVRAASTADVNLASAPATLDGVTPTAGDRWFLKDQSTGADKGVYVYTATGAALTRATDLDGTIEVKQGMAVFVEEGTANADTAWRLTTNSPITLGTTSLTFIQISAASGIGNSVNLQATSPGTVQTGNANLSGTVVAAQFSGGGASVTGVDAVTLNGADFDSPGPVGGTTPGIVSATEVQDGYLIKILGSQAALVAAVVGTGVTTPANAAYVQANQTANADAILEIKTSLNDLIAKLKTHGLIASA